MKKLFILLPLFIACSGPYNLQSYRNIYEVRLNMQIYVLEWDNYVEECYNDSSVYWSENVYMYDSLKSTDSTFCCIEVVDHYNHRIPTQEGYIEYLRKIYMK